MLDLTTKYSSYNNMMIVSRRSCCKPQIQILEIELSVNYNFSFRNVIDSHQQLSKSCFPGTGSANDRRRLARRNFKIEIFENIFAWIVEKNLTQGYILLNVLNFLT